MTNEEFSRKYHLLDRLSQGPVVTHHAQSANGAMVMVHFLRGSSEENAAILGMLDALTPERRTRILSVADVDGVTTIVTKFVLDFTSLRDWLAAGATQTPAPRPDDDAVPVSPAASGGGPGEFTRMFQNPTQQAHAAASPAPSSAAGSASGGPMANPSPSAADPGEFTLLFRGAPPASSPPVIDARPAPPPPFAPPPEPIQPAAPISAPPVPAPPHQAGEFTRVFGAPPLVAPTPQEPPATPPPVQAPSFFGGPVAPAQPSFETPKPTSPFAPPVDPGFDAPRRGFSAPAPQPAPPPTGPGEYTRMFGGPAAPPPMEPGPSRLPPTPATPSMDWGSQGASGGTIGPSRGDAYFDRLVGGTAPPPSVSPVFPPAPQSLPPTPPGFSGPSEFTRIISAAPPSPALTPPAARPIAPPPPVAPPGNPQKSGDRVLLFSLVGVTLLAIVVVAIFLIVS